MPSNDSSTTTTTASVLLNLMNNNKHERQEEKGNYSFIFNQYLPAMTYSNSLTMSTRLSQQQQQLLLFDQEAKILDNNDKLLLPRSTRSLKRRTSLFEKSRDWARRLMTLHRPRRNTTSNEKIRETCYELNRKQETSKVSSNKLLHNYDKSFDEDGYLSPLEIKAKLDNITQENNQHHASLSKSSTNPERNSNVSQLIYRYQDPNIQLPQCTCQQKRLPTTSFVSEFHKSLSIVDYIDFDVPDESSLKQDNLDDDPLESLKYLFADNSKQQQQQQQQQQVNFGRRIPRRSTNTSSISTDSGYSDIPTSSSSSKAVPVHLISCTLIPVNFTTSNSMDIRCLTCTCPSSSTCLANQINQRRKSLSHSSRSQLFRQPYSHLDIIENSINNQCSCYNKYYSTMTICPASIENKFLPKVEDKKEEYYYKQLQKRHLKKQRASLMRLPTVTDDLASISRWYRPYLPREAVYDALQQADYGAFILRNSTTHPDCYALSIKVPKFTHDSNIVHYLIETIFNKNYNSSYRIKGTIKQFPTLLSLLTHHSVMPEILPITLNLDELLAI